MEPIIWIIGFLFIWELVVRVFNFPVTFIPAPSAIAQAFIDLQLVRHFLSTTYVVLAGYVIGIILGIILGTLLAHSIHLERGTSPILSLFQAIPKTVLAPIFIIWFGFGATPRIVATFLLVFFPLLVNTLTGMKITDPDLLSLLRSLRATKFQILMKVRIQRALPLIFSGLKIAAPLAVVGAVTSEFFVGQEGLGYLVLLSGWHIDIPLLFASLVTMAFIGLALYGFVIILERRILHWYLRRH